MFDERMHKGNLTNKQKKGMREFRNFSQAGIRGIKLFAGSGIIFGNITMLN